METNITIRLAQVSDSDSLTPLVAELGYSGSPPEIRQRLDLLLGKNEHTVFVAELDQGKLVGWIHVFEGRNLLGRPFAEIGGLVVHHSHQNEHIGRKLIEKAEGWALDRGLTQMFVRSNIIRLGAAGFYDHLGYRKNKVTNVFWKELEKSAQVHTG